MKIGRLNGTVFEAMIKGGFQNLLNHEQRINDMNVFPVPDGDTGYNMRRTLESGIEYAKPTKHLGNYLSQLSKGMLWGARGNSGVILSQLFYGMSKALEDKGIVNAKEWISALISAYKTAYSAVEHPVEGTMLTVAREGVENIYSQIRRGTTVDLVFSAYLAEMKKSVKNTPDLLAVLKDAGVLDSGAVGYITIFEGMVQVMFGDEVSVKDDTISKAAIERENVEKFNKDSTFEFGYCLEFILQLLNSKCIVEKFSIDGFKKIISQMGNSIVAIQMDSIIKVHIHTHDPEGVIGYARKYGEFVSFKMDNMQVQYTDFVQKKNEPEEEVAATEDLYEIKNAKDGEYKEVAIVAVADGEGIAELLKNCGCDVVIYGGQTQNVSAKEFIDAYDSLNCGKIIVFPNNKNIIGTAKQSAEISGLKDKITVMPTCSVLECYYALEMGSPEIEDFAERVKEMNEGANCVQTLCVARAQKPYKNNEITCNAGDYVAFCGEEVIAAGKDIESITVKAIESVKDIEDKNSIIVLRGKSANEDLENELSKRLEEEFSGINSYFIFGGQSVYDLVMGIV